MAHGYLGDGYGKNGNRDPDGRDDDRHGDWRSDERGHDRDRGRFMFEDRDDRGGRAHGDEGGFASRRSDETRDWVRDEDDDYRSPRQPRGDNRRFEGGQHEPYLRWRQQQMDALDRDYQEYSLERQQQFQRDFDIWRANRQQLAQQPSELELTDQRIEPQPGPDPLDTATLGTNNSENSMPGR